MEAIDMNILFEELDEIPMGLCDACGVPVDYDGEGVAGGPADYCRACAESGVFPA